MGTHPWRGRAIHKPTLKALRAAYDAQAPLDAAPTKPQRKKRVRMVEDELPANWGADGINGIDK